MGDCDVKTVLGSDLTAAIWVIDPAFPAPPPDATEIHVLVWDGSCGTGDLALGRLVGPVITYQSGSIAIAIGARRIDAILACGMPPGTPMTISLTEPLDGRTLLDGSRVPPALPSPP